MIFEQGEVLSFQVRSQYLRVPDDGEAFVLSGTIVLF